MGALLTSIFQGAGRAGSELQRAKTANLQEKQKMQEFALQMRELQGRLGMQGLETKLKSAGQVVHTYKASDGKMHNLVRDPVSGKITDQVAEGTAPEMSQVEQKMQDLEKALGRPLSPEEKGILGGLMPKPTATPSEYERQTGKLKADEELRKRNPQMWRELHPPRASATGFDTRSVADKAKDVQSGTATLKDFPTKERGAIATYMRENKMSAKPKLTAQESKLNDLTKQIEPKVQQLKKILEDSGLAGQNDWVMGNSSALMQWLRFQGYKHGVKPEKTHSDLIKAAAALQVMGAAPWIQIGRGRYLFDQIIQHLPSPTDTPALLYDKATFLQGIMDEAKSSIPQGDQSEETPETIVVNPEDLK